MIVLLVLFYVIAVVLAINRPTYFVQFYLLATTKFLGFLDPASFILGGVEIGYFGLNLLAIFSVFFKKGWYIFPKNIQWFMYFIIAMLFYGIVKPILDNNSSVVLAIIASKETWFYFLFLYVIVYRNYINNEKLLHSLKYLGVYLSLVYIIGSISISIVPPIYNNVSYVRTFFPTYISLAVFLYTIRLKYDNGKSLKDRIIVIVLFLGLLLAAHLSLTVMTLFGFIIYKYVYNEKLQLNKYVITRFAFLVLLGISFIMAIFSGLYDNVSNTVEGIVTGEDNALSSRDIYNEFRWEAINKQSKLGYGFIHQSSSFMKEIKIRGHNRFMERFTVIDSGYVDLLIKFGYVGSTLIILIFVFHYSLGFFGSYKNPLSLAMSFYLIQYLFINYTWSVFTFAHGIVPGIIAYHFLLTSTIKEPNEMSYAN